MAINMAATACQRQRYLEDGHCPLELPNHHDEVDDARCYGLSRWQNTEKRKSAVELLRETKPLYIKSEAVLDGEQESHTHSKDTPILQLPLILPSPPPPPSSPLLPSFSRKTKYEFPDVTTDTISVCVGIVDQGATITTNYFNNPNVNSNPSALSYKTNTDDANKTAFQGCVDEKNEADPSSNHISRYSHRTSSTTGISSDQCDDVPIAVLRSTRLIQPPPAFRKSASSSRLQNKLRKLLVSDSMEKVSDDETDTDKDSVARHEITPTDDLRKNTVRPSNLSSNSQDLSNSVSISCGVNSFFGKSLPDLTSVAVRPKGSRPIPYSTSSDSDAREKWSLTKDVTWASCDPQHLSPLEKGQSSSKKENEPKSEAQNDGGYSVVSSPAGSCFSYITPPPLYCDDTGQLESLRRRLLVARSKSDVGDARNSKTDLVFGVESITYVVPPIDSPNLNTFFDNLGFDSDEFSSIMATRSSSSSPIYLECDGDSSSIESVGGRGSDDENSQKDQASAAAKSLSIVERNARVIKWLCNCRKAFEPLRRFTPMPQSR